MSNLSAISQPIPANAGIGLREKYHQTILNLLPPIKWLEIHSENYFDEGGALLYHLEKIREHYSLSMHGVGLSLGSIDELSLLHLEKIKRLAERVQPSLISEHLSWVSIHGNFLNDLLPLPFTIEAVDHLCNRIDQVQHFLKRQILIENISSYLQFNHSTMNEWEFIVAIAEKSGYGILLDINNIYVNSRNHHFDPMHYISSIPKDFVKEIHLAGFTVNSFENKEILIDTHNAKVSGAVWKLYENAIEYFGKKSTLIEWDTDLPELEVLLAEAHIAQTILEAQDVIA